MQLSGLFCPSPQALAKYITASSDDSRTVGLHIDACASCSATVAKMAAGSQPGVSADASAALTAALPVPHSSHYRFGGTLGSGGMGTVVAAQDHKLQRHVAIKKPAQASAAGEAKLREEAIVSAKLSHPAILPVYELGRDEGGELFLAMRLMRGQSLESACNENLATRIALTRHLIAAADALDYAHRRGFIHRDITPNNIMINPFGDTQLIDWGLGKRHHSTPSAAWTMVDAFASEAIASEASARQNRSEPATTGERGQVVGTAPYMSPEQAHGYKLDASTDIYSLGAVLYRVLANEPPYQGTLFSIVTSVRTEPPPSLRERPELPLPLVAIAERAMQRDPAMRYESAAAFAQDLRNYFDDRAIAAWRSPLRLRLARWFKRNGTSFLIVTCSVIAAALFVAMFSARVLASRDEAAASRRRADDALWLALHDVRPRLSAGGQLSLLQTWVDQIEQAHLAGIGDPELARADLLAARSAINLDGGNATAARGQCEEVLALPPQPYDRRSLETTASCTMLLGDIAVQTNHRDVAKSYYEQAVELQWTILGQGGDHQYSPAVALRALGGLLEGGAPHEAEKYYQQAREVVLAFRATDPDNLSLLRDELAIEVALSDTYAIRDDSAKALSLLESAYQRGQPWFADQNSHALRDQAIIEQRISSLYMTLGKPEAKEWSQKSLSRWKNLADADPGNLQRQEDLLIGYRNLIEIAQRGDPQSAVADMNQAVTIAEALVAKEPKRARWQLTAADLRIAQAGLLSQVAKHDEARSSIDVARQLTKPHVEAAPKEYSLLAKMSLIEYQAALIEIEAEAPLATQSLAIRRWIAASTSANENGGWLSVLVEAYVRLSDVEWRQNKKAAAREAIAIAMQLSKQIQPPAFLAQPWPDELKKMARLIGFRDSQAQ